MIDLINEPRLEITTHFDHIIDLVSHPLHHLRQQGPQHGLYVLSSQFNRAPGFSISVGIPYDSQALWMELFQEFDKSAVQGPPFQTNISVSNQRRVTFVVVEGEMD